MSTHTARPPTGPAPTTTATGGVAHTRWRSLAGRVDALREPGVYLGTLGLVLIGDALARQWLQLGVLAPLVVLALAIRRRSPLVAAAIPLVVMPWAEPGASGPLMVLCYGAGYRIARRGQLYAWFGACVAASLAILAASWWLGVLDLWSIVVEQVAILTVGVALPGLLGQYRAQRHALHAAWRDRVERVDRERAIVAEQARLRERTRIAQDTHDALGHQLALISLQAAALEVDGTLGPAQRETVRHLGATARAAMDELRTVVGALSADDTAAETVPLLGVDELVERARDAGLDVTVVRDGEAQPLSTMTQHALYRVVQESLTNAHKHAPGSPVTVWLRHEPGTLVVEVRNRRSATLAQGPADGGQGIVGLRERVRMIGGLLRAGPEGDDYRVVAILPYVADAVEPDHATRLRGHGPVGRPAPGTAGEPPAGDQGPAVGIVGAGALLLLFAGWVLVSVVVNTTYLTRVVYDTLRVGQTEQTVLNQLPRQLPAPALDVGVPPPSAATCRVFSIHPTDAGPGRGPNTLYRLCFRDGVLVEKREFPA